jgi:hypothetical protein
MTFCESCAFGKQHKEPFPMNGAFRTTKVLGLVHLDVWGPTKVTSFNGSRYFITFTNDFSRITFVSFMQSKNECFRKFQEWNFFAKTQFGKKLKILRTDNGEIFYSREFEFFFKAHGINALDLCTIHTIPKWCR